MAWIITYPASYNGLDMLFAARSLIVDELSPEQLAKVSAGEAFVVEIPAPPVDAEIRAEINYIPVFFGNNSFSHTADYEEEVGITITKDDYESYINFFWQNGNLIYGQGSQPIYQNPATGGNVYKINNFNGSSIWSINNENFVDSRLSICNNNFRVSTDGYLYIAALLSGDDSVGVYVITPAGGLSLVDVVPIDDGPSISLLSMAMFFDRINSLLYVYFSFQSSNPEEVPGYAYTKTFTKTGGFINQTDYEQETQDRIAVYNGTIYRASSGVDELKVMVGTEEFYSVSESEQSCFVYGFDVTQTGILILFYSIKDNHYIDFIDSSGELLERKSLGVFTAQESINCLSINERGGVSVALKSGGAWTTKFVGNTAWQRSVKVAAIDNGENYFLP